MAEFCIECWKKYIDDDPKKKFIVTKHTELCEGCGMYKHVIITERKYYYMYKFKVFIVIWKLIFLPYYIIKHIIKRKNGR